MENVNYKYAIAVIFYYPDEDAIDRIIANYGFMGDILIVDNTDDYTAIDDRIINKLNEIKKHDWIRYHAMKKNVGMSGALNDAYIWAVENEIDYLLTMDQDTDFPEKEIRKIVNVIESNKYKDSALFTSNWRKIYNRGSGELYGKWRFKEKNILTEMAMTSGTFYCMNAIKKYLPLSNLFIGMVDQDISFELKRDGRYGVMIGTAKLSQRVGKTVEGTFWNKLTHKLVLSPVRYYYIGRNIEYLRIKYKGEADIIRVLKLWRWRVVGNLFICEEQKIKKLSMWIKGTNEIRKGQMKLGKYEE